MNQAQIRNFAIVSHINHGKSTLADRLLELTRTVPPSQMQPQFLDSHPIERERGITIKLAPVRMKYTLSPPLKKTFSFPFFIFNLVDTPGHVDFSYEVSRSLKACEGALLLVDAQAGIQAQTMANAQLALENNLTLVPVVNKIDLKTANPQKVAADLIKTFGFKEEEIIFISAKTGQNLDQLIEAIIQRIPPPSGNPERPLRALVFNSTYHPHKGVVVYLRLFDGQITHKLLEQKFILLGTQAIFKPLEIGVFSPQPTPTTTLSAGEIGYLATGLKDINLCQIGDTLTLLSATSGFPAVTPLPGYRPPKPMVFLEFYPVDNQDFLLLKEALEKLKLSDASLSFRPVNSPVLGAGFRLGFLGVFHSEIVQERLERDFNLAVIATAPTVEYQVKLKPSKKHPHGTTLLIQSPAELPDLSQVEQILEPYIKASIFTPVRFLGNVLTLCQENRGTLLSQEFFGDQVKLVYRLPLSQLLTGFFDQLKSRSSGFASLDWEFNSYQPFDAALLNVLLNRRPIPNLSFLVPRSQAYPFARRLARKLKEVIPRQQFEVAIQVAIGQKVIARERIPPLRKDVTAKLYGGDQTRKDKLLEKQKKGKKRLKAVGRITLSQEALQAVLTKN